jgi:hypothetical protein
LPSTVAFPPGYKIAGFEGGELVVDTGALDAAAGHDRAFAANRRELARTGGGHRELAEAASLGEFLSRHVAALAADRYLPREWPPAMAARARMICVGDLARVAGAADTSPLPFAVLVADWYRLRKGRELAHRHIPAARLARYRDLAAAFSGRAWPEASAEAWIAGFLRMLASYLDGPPSGDFAIDLATGEVRARRGYRGRTERRQTGAA